MLQSFSTRHGVNSRAHLLTLSQSFKSDVAGHALQRQGFSARQVTAALDLPKTSVQTVFMLELLTLCLMSWCDVMVRKTVSSKRCICGHAHHLSHDTLHTLTHRPFRNKAHSLL